MASLRTCYPLAHQKPVCQAQLPITNPVSNIPPRNPVSKSPIVLGTVNQHEQNHVDLSQSNSDIDFFLAEELLQPVRYGQINRVVSGSIVDRGPPVVIFSLDDLLDGHSLIFPDEDEDENNTAIDMPLPLNLANGSKRRLEQAFGRLTEKGSNLDQLTISSALGSSHHAEDGDDEDEDENYTDVDMPLPLNPANGINRRREQALSLLTEKECNLDQPTITSPLESNQSFSQDHVRPRHAGQHDSLLESDDFDTKRLPSPPPPPPPKNFFSAPSPRRSTSYNDLLNRIYELSTNTAHGVYASNITIFLDGPRYRPDIPLPPRRGRAGPHPEVLARKATRCVSMPKEAGCFSTPNEARSVSMPKQSGIDEKSRNSFDQVMFQAQQPENVQQSLKRINIDPRHLTQSHQKHGHD